MNDRCAFFTVYVICFNIFSIEKNDIFIAKMKIKDFAFLHSSNLIGGIVSCTKPFFKIKLSNAVWRSFSKHGCKAVMMNTSRQLKAWFDQFKWDHLIKHLILWEWNKSYCIAICSKINYNECSRLSIDVSLMSFMSRLQNLIFSKYL